MTTSNQFMVGLIVIVSIAAIDWFVIVELQPNPPDMVWIDGAEFASDSEAEFTEQDESQNYQMAGFWIDKSVVSKSEYQAFLSATGYRNVPVHPDDQVFMLRDAGSSGSADQNLQYISQQDAFAYCNWKGKTLSNKDQVKHSVKSESIQSEANATEVTIHASHPLSRLSGVRCVKVPEWAYQQGSAELQ